MSNLNTNRDRHVKEEADITKSQNISKENISNSVASSFAFVFFAIKQPHTLENRNLLFVGVMLGDSGVTAKFIEV